MSIDPGPIGEVTAELMDQLEDEHPDAELVDVVVIAEIDYTDEDGDDCAAYRWKSMSESPAKVAGLALIVLRGSSEGV